MVALEWMIEADKNEEQTSGQGDAGNKRARDNWGHWGHNGSHTWWETGPSGSSGQRLSLEDSQEWWVVEGRHLETEPSLQRSSLEGAGPEGNKWSEMEPCRYLSRSRSRHDEDA